MPKFGPIKHKDLVKYLKVHGFDGPYYGGKHPFMIKENLTITLPNPHKGDIGKELLGKILKQANISKEKWENG
jgi:predicted RNA binding protein YcfA (HicA-like mRNA interferase family)